MPTHQDAIGPKLSIDAAAVDREEAAMPEPKAEFSDVDRAGDPAYYVWALDEQLQWPFTRRYKQRARELLGLGPGQRALDVGCGTGFDVAAMAGSLGRAGRAVGIDASRVMAGEAGRRCRALDLPLDFAAADVSRLPFADGSFDGCHADRTFQHLRDPREALAEMVRVTRPGGRVLVVDGDHETTVIDSPYSDVTRRFLTFRAGTLQHGGVAHQCFRLLQALGLVDVTVDAMVRITTDYAALNRVMHYDGGIRLAAEYGIVTQDEAERWVAAVEEAARLGRFLCATTFFLTVGRKPA